MTKVYLGFGSNLGNKVGNIRRAIALLKQAVGIQKVGFSSFYKTAPVGNVEQDWFVNAVACIETSLSASELLELCLRIEKDLKRVRNERWGPRTLDIDILYFGGEEVDRGDLKIPHPRVQERAFVLEPLLELEPNFAWKGELLSEALEALGEQGVERMVSRVAILGASEKPDRYSNKAQVFLKEEGYQVALVSPRGGVILGEPVARSLVDCVDPVDTVTLYVGSERLGLLLPDLLQVCPRRVIFNPGTENGSVRDALEEAGIETLEACTLVLLRTGQF